MSKTAKSKADEQFTATQRKAIQTRKENEKVRQERAEHVARLRALRLAKEAADKTAAAKKAATKNKKPSRLPQGRPR